jgi:site-specific DNA-methyltransferase (adenine-specific)
MDFMKGLPDNAYDLAIVDPPYGLSWDGQEANNKTNRLKHVKKDWDSAIPTSDYFMALFRVSVNQIIWGGNFFNDYLGSYRCPIVWDKLQKWHSAEMELAWSSLDAMPKTFRFSRAQAYTGGDKIHPTQKPIALYKWLLQNYAKPGQTIFDSHVGSGSIRIACHDLGFSFEGCELDADYHAAQEARFNEHKAQLTLFEPEEIREPVQQIELDVRD